MRVKYLLPCACGKKVPIELTQAGQTVRCGCGAKLDVPTMRRISRLERADISSTYSTGYSVWGLRQRVAFVGVLLLAAASVAAIVAYKGRPTPPVRISSPDAIREEIAKLTPLQSVILWENLRRGLKSDASQQEVFSGYERALRAYRAWLWGALGTGGLGLIVIGSSLLIARRKR